MLIPTWLKNLGYMIAAVLGVKYDAVLAFSVLMLIDVFTGIIASASVNGWRSITSRRLSFGVLSKLCLLLIPLSIALAGKVIDRDLSTVVGSAIFVMTIAESYSITGNIYTIKTGKRVPEFDAISIILSKIREILNNATERLPSGPKD